MATEVRECPQEAKAATAQGSTLPDGGRCEMKLLPHHLKELQASGIDESLAALNFESLSGSSPYDALLYSDRLERLNGGRLSSHWLNRYRHIQNGGWWCSGLDPLNNWEKMLWGCLKPDTPRKDGEGKTIKYEHPPKTDTRAFFLRVPLHVWHAVSQNFNVPMPENIVISEDGEALDFWEWVRNHPQIAIALEEGAKKAASLLSCGIVSIAIPGIYNGYRQLKDANGNKIPGAFLIPELKVFAQEGREIVFAFDKDEKQKTQHNVKTAIIKTGKLFLKQECKVSVLDWDGKLGKGIDDVLVNQGVEFLASILAKRDDLETWELKQSARLTYPISRRLNSRYLGEFSPPIDKQFICLKAGKGQGKTEWIAQFLAPHLRNGGKALVPVHRIQLGQSLCDRFGVPYVSELNEFVEGTLFGLGLCVDSLHINSQAKFKTEDWAGAWLIIDEIVQQIWHLLNSSTMKDERVKILQNFKELIQLVLSTGGKIICADADLNDFAIDFIRSLAGYDLEPWIVENNYQDESCEWKVFKYDGNSPEKIVAALIKAIKRGEKPLVQCSAQRKKSRWGSQNLEALLKKAFPDINILRIDSESVSDPEHPSYGCISKINDLIPKYDIVIASPTIETGVSIDVKHFTSVWGIFQGVQPVNSCCQALARVRDNVPRHVWAKGRGVGFIANGETSYKAIQKTQHRIAKANISSLKDACFTEEIDTNSQPESLRTWAKMAAYINMGMYHYRESIFAQLEEEGHHIIDLDDEEMLQSLLDRGENIIEVSDADGEAVAVEVKNTKTEELANHIKEVVETAIPESFNYDELANKRAKTKGERLLFEKGTLSNKYGVEITPELVQRDYDGWHPKIKLHYLLGVGREFLDFKDKSRASKQLEKGDGAVWLPDFNRYQMSVKIKTLEAIRLNWLLEKLEFRNDDPELIEWAESIKQNAAKIKERLGIKISPKYSPVVIVKKFLDLIGYRLPMLRKEGKRGQQVRVYGKAAPGFQLGDDRKPLLNEEGQAIPIPDGRDEVFTVWLARDAEAVAKASAPPCPVATTVERNGAMGQSVVSNQSVVSRDKQYIFTGADYQGADYQGADYQGADYQGADYQDEPTELQKLIERVKLITGEAEFWQLYDEVGREKLEDAVIYQGDRQKYQMLSWLRQGRG